MFKDKNPGILVPIDLIDNKIGIFFRFIRWGQYKDMVNILLI